MKIPSTNHFVFTDNGFIYEQQAQLSGYPKNEKEFVQQEFSKLANSPRVLEGLKTQLLISPGGVGPGMRVLFAKWRIERERDSKIVLTMTVREFIAQVREASIDIPGLLSAPYPEMGEEAAVNLVNIVGLDNVTKDYLLTCIIMGDIIPEHAARAAVFNQMDKEIGGILTSYFNSQNGLVEIFTRQFESFQLAVEPNEERNKTGGRHYNVSVLPFNTELTGFSYLLSASELLPKTFTARCITALPDPSLMQEAIWELQEYGFDRRPKVAEEPTTPHQQLFDVAGITLISAKVFHFVGSSKKDFVQNALAMTRDNVDPDKVVNVPEFVRGVMGYGAFYFRLDQGTVIGGEFDEYNGTLYHFFVDAAGFPGYEHAVDQPIPSALLNDVQGTFLKMVNDSFKDLHPDNHLFIIAQRF
jgi:hypothetical protein